MPEAYTLDQWKKIHAKQRYKYICFKDMNGEIIVPYNSNKVTAAARIKEIETRIETQTGNHFIIEGKTSISPKAKADPFYIVKDPTLKDSPSAVIEATVIEPARSVQEGVNVRSYEYVLELEKRVNKLELENKALLDKIDLLEEELEEASFLDDDEPEGNGTMDWLSSTFEMVTPLIDKFFQQRDQLIKIETIKLHREMNPNGAAPKPEPQIDQQAVNHFLDKIKEFIGEYEEEDPDTCQDLINIFNSSSNMDHFFNQVGQYNKEILDEMQKYINGRQGAEN